MAFWCRHVGYALSGALWTDIDATRDLFNSWGAWTKYFASARIMPIRCVFVNVPSTHAAFPDVEDLREYILQLAALPEIKSELSAQLTSLIMQGCVSLTSGRVGSM